MHPAIGCRLSTPFGEAACTLDETGALARLKLGADDDAARTSSATLPEPARNTLDALSAQFVEYFAGERREFELQLAPRGTEFQRRVWTELQRIPYGATISYGELARRLGDPKAVRAVGRANGANPIWIVIPCHRVIGADGSLTGYGGGIEVKRKLLELEGAIAPGLFG